MRNFVMPKSGMGKTVFNVSWAGAIALLLAACSSAPTASTPESGAAPAAPEASAIASSPAPGDHSQPQHGGQVIESGPYHLELVPLSEPEQIHLDFYLQRGDTHEAIPNATVTAELQFPNGSQKSVPLTYDGQGAHYVAEIPDAPLGEYKVAILSDVNGEKVNGRFSFNHRP